MGDKFIKVDLHIHTPASPCYEGNRSDQREYLRILHKAVEEGIKVIAVTDHNSITGYKNILKIKTELINEKKYLQPIKDSEQTQIRLSEIEDDLQVFNSLFILPGVEFQTSNCVHVLVIFNPKYDTSVIEGFLTEAGFDIESSDVHDSMSRWCVLDLLDNTSQYDCFCVDAHTDSDKGMYKSLIGKTRGAAFSNPQLKAIAYKSHDTISKIESLLSSKEFSRSNPVSFVKFSDAHSLEAIGKHYTWIKLESLDYTTLAMAMCNPIECVSIEEPEVALIIRNLINEAKSIFVENIDDFESIAKSIIALANSGGGYCLIGVNKAGKSKGVVYSPDLDSFDELFKKVSPLWVSSGDFRIYINDYELQGKKFLISFFVQPDNGVAYYKDEETVYRQSKNSFVKASPEFIETMVEAELLRKVKKMIRPRIEEIENNIALVKGSFDNLRLISNIRSKMVNLYRYSKVTVLRSYEASSDDEYIKAMATQKRATNGLASGNILIFDKELVPRFPYAFLRLSAPTFGYKDGGEPNAPKNSIVVSETGCVFLIDRDSHIISEEMDKFLLVHIDCPSEHCERLTAFFALYLKSTFLLWYLLSSSENINIFPPAEYRKVKFPIINLKNCKTIETLDRFHVKAQNIISHERAFLECVSALVTEDSDGGDVDMVMKHNKTISTEFQQVDSEIYQLLGLNDEDISIIENRVKCAGLYVHEENSGVDESSGILESNSTEALND